MNSEIKKEKERIADSIMTAMLYGVGKTKEAFEKEIEKHVEMLDGNIVSVKWLVDGEKRCDSLTADVGYDDEGKLVLRLHDNYIERTGLTNMFFSKADMEFRIDTKEKIKVAAAYIEHAIKARR